MKKSLLGILALSVLTVLFSLSILFAQDLISVVDANNQFAFDLYSRYKSKDGNIFFSPYSISSVLAMVYDGARGKTAEEIQEVFHFPEDTSILRQSSLKIYQIYQLNQSPYKFLIPFINFIKKYELRIANALWAQKDYKFLDDYFNLVEKYYGGKVTNLDFVKDAEKSRLTINNWVEEQTNEKIKDLIPPGFLDYQTRLVLTNAIYFKGLWSKPFDKKNTKEENFRVSLGNTIKVKMMSLAGKSFLYAETENLQILNLPYAGKTLGLSMFILLPKNDDLKSMENSMSSGKLAELKNSLIRERVDVYIPKFKFETKYFMANDLKSMGMPTAFTAGIDFGGKADFSGMTGNKQLNIDEVIHQAFVDVSEEGTEAAATIGFTGKLMDSEKPPEIKIFRADHPFIFIIQDRETGNILFMGRVCNPT